MAARARFVVAAIVVVAACLLTADAAHATWLPGPPPSGASPHGTSQTEVTMNGVAEGQGVSGFAALPGNKFDPVKEGYPSSNPIDGLSAAGRVVRRDHSRHAGLGRRGASPLLHRPAHRDLERDRIRPRRLERCRRPERRLRRPGPRRLLPEHQRAFCADETSTRRRPSFRPRSGSSPTATCSIRTTRSTTRSRPS